MKYPTKGITVRVDSHAAQGAARRMCDQLNLSVSFDLSNGQTPCTEKGRIHLCPPLPSWTDDDLLDWWGQLIHETRHNTVRGVQCFDVAKQQKLNMESLQGGMFNLFEDGVVDFIGNGDYVGQDETTDQHVAKSYDKIFNDPKKHKFLWHNPKLEDDTIVVATSMLLDAWARQEYQPSIIGKANAMLEDPKLNPIVKERFEKTLANGWGEKLIKLQKDSTAQEVWQWMNDMFEDIHNIDPPPPPPENDEGDGQGDEGEGEDQGQDSRGDKMSKEGKKALNMIFEEHAADPHEHDIHKKIERTGNMKLEYGVGSGKYTAASANEITIIDYAKRQILDGTYRPTKGDFSNWEQAADQYDLECYDGVKHRDSLAQEVRRHIQSEARLRVNRNLKKGKLDKNKLYKLNVQGASEDWKNRVFWKKEHKLVVKNTVISLLLDNSGSMGGTKIACGIHAMDLVGDVCRSLGIDYEMAGFTTRHGRGSRAVHILYKPFGVKVQRSQIKDNMFGAAYHMSSNADGEDVLIAFHRLQAQKAQRRIMIVMSDGQPASSGGDCCWYLKEVVRGIESSSNVEIHGLGIMSEEVRHYYSSNSVIAHPEDLENALLNVLKNKIINAKGN